MREAEIPAAFRPFVELARKWGEHRTGEQRHALADRIEESPEQLRELTDFAAGWPDSYWRILDKWENASGRELGSLPAHFRELLSLVEELELPRGPADDPILDILGLLEDGANVHACVQAVLSLAQYGEDAAPAIPAIVRATQASSHSVRIAAHTALGVLVGDAEAHRAAIVAIARKHGKRDLIDWTDHALRFLDSSPPERDREAFAGACIVGNMRQLTRLIDRVDVNVPDKDGTLHLHRAIMLTDLCPAEFLLQHGANPNLACAKTGGTALHSAAWRRRGAEKVRLLLRWGANPLIRNRNGERASDIAREFERHATIGLLEDAEASAR